jgi:hypothetical protein
MSFRIRGIPRVIQNLEQVHNNVRTSVEKTVLLEGERLLQHLKDRTAHEYQEVLSYVWESILGLPGTKSEYADRELIGTFARRAPKLDPPWDRQIQLYRKERHQLRELLGMQFKEKARGVFVSRVGYPRDVGRRGRSTRYVVWVLFGTKKMQARPFLTLTLDEHEADYMMEITRSIRQALAQTAFV